jgi:putative DNA primase/helicase
LFRLSPRGQREKCQEREDYVQRTIERAIEDQEVVYQDPPKEPEDDNAEANRPNEAVDDPHRLARLYVQQHCTHPDGLTLRSWQNRWHRWMDNAYQRVPNDEMEALLSAHVKTEFDRVNLEELRAFEHKKKAGELKRDDKPPVVRQVIEGRLGNVLRALREMTLVPASTEQPAWLNGKGPFPAREVLATANGLFSLSTLQLTPPTPNFFSPNVLDYDFDPNAPSPTAWLAFLGQLWPNDRWCVETLQEWFGYCLTADTSQQKILLLVGPPRSGKGTIARVLQGLVGKNNVAGPTLSGLATGFGLSGLVGKTVAVISDARLSARADSAIVVERLLSISGEDTLTVDRKYRELCDVKLTTRLMILTNELPRVADSSGALARRMLLLRLTESFLDREDSTLTDRLVAELPGILLWAIEGWRRLQERGRFTQPNSGREMLDDLEELTSPIMGFIRDCCVVVPDQQVGKEELYQQWVKWCEGEGRQPGNKPTFCRDLLAAAPSIRSSQPRVDGKRTTAYTGIGLAPKVSPAEGFVEAG